MTDRDLELQRAAWNEGFIAGVNAADAGHRGVYAAFDQYTHNPYERPGDER